MAKKSTKKKKKGGGKKGKKKGKKDGGGDDGRGGTVTWGENQSKEVLDPEDEYHQSKMRMLQTLAVPSFSQTDTDRHSHRQRGYSTHDAHRIHAVLLCYL